MKEDTKLLTTKKEWQTANMYFHANVNIHRDITNIKHKLRVFQFCTYDYFKLIDNYIIYNSTRNSLSTEYNHLKTVFKELKNGTDNEDSTSIRYVSKLVRVKYSKKGN